MTNENRTEARNRILARISDVLRFDVRRDPAIAADGEDALAAEVAALTRDFVLIPDRRTRRGIVAMVASLAREAASRRET